MTDQRYTLNPAQERFIRAATSGQYRYLGYGGAIRSSKTYGVIFLINLLLKAYPGLRCHIVRRDLPTMRRTIIPSFLKLRSPRFHGHLNQSTWTITCANGSEVTFFPESLEVDPEYDRWKGLETNVVFLEQGEELDVRTFEWSIQRAGTWRLPNQPPPLVISTFNPAPGWVKYTFYDPWLEGRLAPPYYFQAAHITDNLDNLDPEYVASLKNLPEGEYRRFVLGVWENLAGKALAMLNARIHLVPPFEVPSHWRHAAAMDWGYRHLTAYAPFAINEDGAAFGVDTAWGQWLEPPQLVERFRGCGVPFDRLDSCVSGHDLWQEKKAYGPPPPTLFDQFVELGLVCRKANIARVAGLTALRYALAWKRPDGTRIDPLIRLMATEGNRRLFTQLGDMVLDDLAKGAKAEDVKKVDCDAQGRGGDDGYDMVRYFAAGRWSEAAERERLITKVEPHTWAVLAEQQKRITKRQDQQIDGITDPDLAGYL